MPMNHHALWPTAKARYRCLLCGKENLRAREVAELCPNPLGYELHDLVDLTRNESQRPTE